MYDCGGDNGEDGVKRNPRWMDERRLEIGVVLLEDVSVSVVGMGDCC
jgi:hypothetical protein